MIDHQQWAGAGILEIQDKTDSPDKVVDIWFGTYMGESRQQDIVWSYKVDDNQSGLQNFHFATGGSWQHVSTIFVGYAQQFTLHLDPTVSGTIFTGPVDWTVDLNAGSNTKTIALKDGDVWKRAIPFVKVDGVWQLVIPYVMLNSEWKEAT